MELHYLLYLFVLNDFAVSALHRVERATNCPQITNFPGRVKYKRKGTRAVFRCPKKFDRYGPKDATCKDDGIWSNEPPLCTKTGCVPLDQSLVSNLNINVVNQAVVKFSCEQNYHLIGETLAYCNGKDWSAPLPRCAAPHELMECDFEEDLCGWTQDDSDEQDWIRTVGPTPTGHTGPKYDHTYGDIGNGHYLFFDTSNSTITSPEAILYSPVYDEHLSPMCFEFWYNISCPDEAICFEWLTVYVLNQSQDIYYFNYNNSQLLLEKHGDKWQRFDMFIDSQVESYQIVISATTKFGYISEFAIDDVRLYNCSRQNKTGKTATMAQTSTPYTTNPNITTFTSGAAQMTFTSTNSTTESATTTTQMSTTPKLSTKESTLKIAQTSTTPRPTSKESTATVQTSTTMQPSTTEFTTTITQTSNTLMPSTTRSTTSPKHSTLEITTTTTQTSVTLQPLTTPKASTKKSKRKTTQTLITPSSSITESTFFSNSSRIESTTTTTHAIKSTTAFSLTKTTTEVKTSSMTTTNSHISLPTSNPSPTTSPSRKEKTPTTVGTSTSKTDISTEIPSTTSSMLTSARNSSSTSLLSTLITPRIDLLTTSQASTDHTNEKSRKEMVTSNSQHTNTRNTTTALGTTRVPKPTKSTNDLTTKQSVVSKTSKDNSILVSNESSKDFDNEILTPLLIGLCVGIVAGLIIIGVIACVCVRRRKLISSNGNELKPMNNSVSVRSLNDGHQKETENRTVSNHGNQETQYQMSEDAGSLSA